MKETQEIREMSITGHLARLYVRAVGDPEADNVLITIHGGPGLSHRPYLGLEQLASSELAVVSYDQRGSGRSSRPSTGDFDLLTHARDLEAVRSLVAGQRPVHLLGHSWGGLVAMYYALRYPQQVRSLLLVGSMPPTWSGLGPGMACLEARIRVLQQQGIIPMDFSADPLEWLKQIFPVYLADSTLALPLDGLEYDATVGQLTMTAVQGYDLTEQVAHLSHRVLILWGEADPFCRAWAEETEAAFSGARVEFVVIPRCGHLGWMECPDAFFRPVRTFLGLSG